METELTKDLKLWIQFEAQKEVPPSRHYPGDPAELEITDITIEGCRISGELFDALLKNHGEELEEACWDKAVKESDKFYEGMAEDLMDAAEHRWDTLEDR